MKTLRFSALLLFIFFIIPASVMRAAPYGTEGVSTLVTSEWLAANINNSGVVILHVSGIKADYNSGHIAGAQFLWPGSLIISNETESTLPAPAKEVIKTLQKLGVNSDSHIVLCGIYGNIVQVCRVFVTLEHFGFRGKVSILDGWVEEWLKSGHQITKDLTPSKKGKVSPVVYDNLVDASWMLKNLENKSFAILDARPKVLYDGTTGSPRQGHIRGAKNIPPTDLFDSKTSNFFPSDKLKENFGKLGIAPGVRPVFYCHSGNSASVAYVASLILGYDPIVYDGSMEEWGGRPDLPMEK